MVEVQFTLIYRGPEWHERDGGNRVATTKQKVERYLGVEGVIKTIEIVLERTPWTFGIHSW